MTTDRQKAKRRRFGGRLYNFGVAGFLAVVLLLAVDECDDEDTHHRRADNARGDPDDKPAASDDRA